MTSKIKRHEQAFVWIWLPDEVDPVVAGKLEFDDEQILFQYGRSYLERGNAISIYDVELPLKLGAIPLLKDLSAPGCIRDGAPDSWGQRVIENRLSSMTGRREGEDLDLDLLTLLLESGSDRIGALDFQRSSNTYQPRVAEQISLEQLQTAAQLVEEGVPLPKELEQAIHYGTAIGGARPKVLIEEKGHKYLAKFSSSTDPHNVVKTEFLAMRLALRCGLNVASVRLTEVAHKDVLLVERFDRLKRQEGWTRRSMLSALTLLGLDEMAARYASYEDLARIVRARFTDYKQTLNELFGRLVFNVLCGNTDDHARNHAAFWDGKVLTLTPAYDICPPPRTGNVASQAMRISNGNNMSKITSCLEAANHFQLSQGQAKAIVKAQIACIESDWTDVCDEAELSEIERASLWRRQFLNPYAFEGWQET